MNLLLLEPTEILGDTVLLEDERRTKHLLKVLKVEVGRSLKVGIIGGGRGLGTVTKISPGSVEVRVDVEEQSAPTPSIDLVLALPRPAVLHRILQNAAAMGIGRLDLVNAWRVEKSFFQSPALQPENLRRHLILGAEQGATTALPTVQIHNRLVRFLEELPPHQKESTARVLAHPTAAKPIESMWQESMPPRIKVAIGPEGGWIGREIATFGEIGFVSASLGPWILRVESAMTAALAQIALLRRFP